MTPISFTDLVSHPALLGPHFAGPSWDRWKAFGKAIFAEPMSKAEIDLLREVADRDPPKSQVSEAVAIAGRGGGKDSIASAIAVKIAIGNYRARLRPGEKAVVMVISVDRRQSEIAFNYIRAAFEETAALAGLVRAYGDDTVELHSNVVIELHTNSFRGLRGRTVIAAIFDEAAFWRDETSATPDVETYAAVRPGLARMPGSMLIIISTAHKRTGLLYQRWKECFGRDDADALVVRGSTLQFNPSFDAEVIEKDLARDPQLYGAEYNSEWRDDLSTFLERALVEAAVEKGMTVRPPQERFTYEAFADPSGGVGDSFTLGIAHRDPDDDAAVLDCSFERRAPFNPSEVVAEIKDLLLSYRLAECTGDKYAASWVIEAFARVGITYHHSHRDRSAIYLNAAPLFTTGRARLLDNARLVAQLCGLERRTMSGGRDRVDHGPHGHDDLANSAAGALVLAARKPVEIPMTPPLIITKSDVAQAAGWRAYATGAVAASGVDPFAPRPSFDMPPNF